MHVYIFFKLLCLVAVFYNKMMSSGDTVTIKFILFTLHFGNSVRAHIPYYFERYLILFKPTDGRQAQHTKGQDTQQALTRPHSMQIYPKKQPKEIKHLLSCSQTLK